MIATMIGNNSLVRCEYNNTMEPTICYKNFGFVGNWKELLKSFYIGLDMVDEMGRCFVVYDHHMPLLPKRIKGLLWLRREAN